MIHPVGLGPEKSAMSEEMDAEYGMPAPGRASASSEARWSALVAG